MTTLSTTAQTWETTTGKLMALPGTMIAAYEAAERHRYARQRDTILALLEADPSPPLPVVTRRKGVKS